MWNLVGKFDEFKCYENIFLVFSNIVIFGVNGYRWKFMRILLICLIVVLFLY